MIGIPPGNKTRQPKRPEPPDVTRRERDDGVSAANDIPRSGKSRRISVQQLSLRQVESALTQFVLGGGETSQRSRGTLNPPHPGQAFAVVADPTLL